MLVWVVLLVSTLGMTAGFDAALVARQQEKYRYLRDEQDQRALFESSNSTSSLILLNADKVHGFNFTLGTKLGQGGFGAVYIARSILTDSDQFVAKIEPNTSNSLLFEAKVYDTLSALEGFPKKHWSGTVGDKNVLVLDRLGGTIKSLLVRDHKLHTYKPFTERFVAWVGLQCIDLLERLHSDAFLIHRDLKPSNIALPTTDKYRPASATTALTELIPKEESVGISAPRQRCYDTVFSYSFMYNPPTPLQQPRSSGVDTENAVNNESLRAQDIHPDCNLFLIDFGVSAYYMVNETRIVEEPADTTISDANVVSSSSSFSISPSALKHFHFSQGRHFIGTSQFASLNAHDGVRLSRRDDMISLGYTLVYMLRGSLPWSHDSDNDEATLVDMKRRATDAHLCADVSSSHAAEFRLFLDHTRALGFYDKPNYNYLRQILKRIF